jgi:hypothetical protein
MASLKSLASHKHSSLTRPERHLRRRKIVLQPWHQDAVSASLRDGHLPLLQAILQAQLLRHHAPPGQGQGPEHPAKALRGPAEAQVVAVAAIRSNPSPTSGRHRQGIIFGRSPCKEL